MALLGCKKCQSLEEQVRFLREANEKLTQALIAMKDKPAFASVHAANGQHDTSGYYGGENDDLIEYDEFGREILVKRGQQ